MMRPVTLLLCILLLSMSCKQGERDLPILGNATITEKDTLYPVIPPFSFVNQDSTRITEKTFSGKIYVADFIFLSCPTICPKMTSELTKVYHEYEDNPDVLFISHTIDPERDTVERLKDYTSARNIDSSQWFFVTGNRDSIYKLAEESYYTTAYADSKEPGGYVHGGGFLLIDKNRHVRGVYDGTQAKEAERLINDISVLLNE